jgi:hypothetical protein
MTDVIESPLPTPPPIEATELPLPEEPPAPNLSETAYVEYGLKVPNGAVHWGSFLNRPLDSAEARSVFVQVLKATAAEMGWDETEFLSRYTWQGRHVHLTDLGVVPITSEAAAPTADPNA